jgi:hypothetical protein
MVYYLLTAAATGPYPECRRNLSKWAAHCDIKVKLCLVLSEAPPLVIFLWRGVVSSHISATACSSTFPGRLQDAPCRRDKELGASGWQDLILVAKITIPAPVSVGWPPGPLCADLISNYNRPSLINYVICVFYRLCIVELIDSHIVRGRVTSKGRCT